MRPIQMVDLKQQYHHIKVEIDNAVLGVLESSVFIGGKPVQDFAQHLATYTGAGHVIPCANGTDALQIAMMALDLKPGDEHYLVVREKYTAFEAAVGGTPIGWAIAYAFCKNVESNKTSFHEIRKVSKEAWTEISKTKSKAVAGTYDYKDEELKAAREEQLK
jgi:hypothetical protein